MQERPPIHFDLKNANLWMNFPQFISHTRRLKVQFAETNEAFCEYRRDGTMESFTGVQIKPNRDQIIFNQFLKIFEVKMGA